MMMMIVCNHMLLSTLLGFFKSLVRGGSNKELKKIISTIHNFLWYTKKTTCSQ